MPVNCDQEIKKIQFISAINIVVYLVFQFKWIRNEKKNINLELYEQHGVTYLNKSILYAYAGFVAEKLILQDVIAILFILQLFRDRELSSFKKDFEKNSF